MPLAAVLKSVPIVLAGLVINLIIGVMFFFTPLEGYWTNWMFKLKMALIIFAGLNAAWFTFVQDHRVRALRYPKFFDKQTRRQSVERTWTCV